MLDTTDLLQDIATQIQIRADFTLQHPDYPDWETAEIVVDRLQASPREIQAKFICTQLQAYLHCIYFSRSLLPLNCAENAVTSSDTINNDHSGGINPNFYDQLEQANCGQGYYDTDWLVQDQLVNGHFAVSKEGLRLQVQPDDIADRTAPIGSLVSIKLPKNLLTVDRYVAVGDQGRVSQTSLIYLYFNCPSSVAVNLMTKITQNFNQLRISFELHVLLHPDQYPLADALMLKCAATDYEKALPGLHQLLATYQSEFYDSIPALSQPLAKGVGKIAITATTLQDFPRQFWRLVAQALSQAWLQNTNSEVDKINRIQQELRVINLYLDRS
jgi:HopA1 effector protein family